MLYPNQSSFVVPFSSTLQNFPSKNYLDQVVKGSIYFSFSLSLNKPIASGYFQVLFPSFPPLYPPTYRFAYLSPLQSVSGNIYNPISGFQQSFDANYSLIKDYYKGYYLKNLTTNESEIIKSYDPSSGLVTFEKPFINPITPGDRFFPGDKYSILSQYPLSSIVFIPPIDNNFNLSLDYEGSYNGYYLVFESENPNYSNATNSNIFYKKIAFYDPEKRVAYLDSPIPFDINNYSQQNSEIEFTIRKSLPLERWTLDKATYNNITTKNIITGPLIGIVITLPQNASSIDNYYKGKYVYFASNQADTYNPPYPNPDNLETPIPNTFYPIYGIYYIKAYNGETKELSVCQDLTDISCETIKKAFNPPTYQILDYNSSSLKGLDFFDPFPLGDEEYQAFPLGFPCCPVPGTLYIDAGNQYQTGKKYKITFRVKYQNMYDSYFEVIGGYQSYLSSPLSSDYTTFEIIIVPLKNRLQFRFYMNYDLELAGSSIIWDFFQMETVDIINICDIQNDNVSPLNYNGSIVSQNETSCYEISLLNLTIPNLPLLTGSRISFYPYVYVEISNVSTPNKASTAIIYSNNPESKKSLFIAPVGQVARPNLGTFIVLSSSMKQTVKFKPNDSIQFRVFLPDGKLIQTLLPDTFSPYGYDLRLQIGAVFSILRVSSDSIDFRNKMDKIK
jgi:hypothetical protein